MRNCTLFLMMLVSSTCYAQAQNDPFGGNNAQPAIAKKSETTKKQPLPDLRVREVLEKTMTFDFDETPWSDVESMLEKDLGINIVLTVSARDDSLTPDEPVSCSLSGISVKNGLRSMLLSKNATYAVKNGVLMILSKDDELAPQFSQTRIFCVQNILKKISELEKSRIDKSTMEEKQQVLSAPPVVGKQGGGGRGFGGGSGLGGGRGNNNEKRPITAESILTQLIQESVDPNIWIENGGVANISIVGGQAVMFCPNDLADSVSDFLNEFEHYLVKE